jgi:hypothetical protein
MSTIGIILIAVAGVVSLLILVLPWLLYDLLVTMPILAPVIQWVSQLRKRR